MEKKIKVINRLGKMADSMDVKIDYIIEKDREYLVCDKTKICTSHTTTDEIEQEFIGYVFLKKYKRYLGVFSTQTKNQIKQYWFDENFNQPWIKV